MFFQRADQVLNVDVGRGWNGICFSYGASFVKEFAHAVLVPVWALFQIVIAF
jgi:hypothetical protein